MTARKACAFCQTTANKISNEDAIPYWALTLLGEKTKIDFLRNGKTPKSWPIKGREGGLRINEVCKPCNEGWMHHLEESVRPFLSKMILHRTPTKFDGNRSRHLASWGLKTTMVMDLLNDVADRHFSVSDRKQFSVIPSVGNVSYAVYLGRYSGNKYRALTYDQFFEMTAQRNDGLSFSFNGYSSTLVLGKMILQTVSVKPRNIVLLGAFLNNDWISRSVQIWPFKKENGSLYWPLSAIDDKCLFRFMQRWGPPMEQC